MIEVPLYGCFVSRGPTEETRHAAVANNDDRLRVGRLGGVPLEQKMLKGHLPRVIYHHVNKYMKIIVSRLG